MFLYVRVFVRVLITAQATLHKDSLFLLPFSFPLHPSFLFLFSVLLKRRKMEILVTYAESAAVGCPHPEALLQRLLHIRPDSSVSLL